MSDFAWVLVGVALVAAMVGVASGVIIDPHDPWKAVFESAAAATGVLAAVLVLAAVAALIAHPSNAHGDQEAGVQVVFIGLFVIPLYAPALAGAVIGKLLGRRFRRSPVRT